MFKFKKHFSLFGENDLTINEVFISLSCLFLFSLSNILSGCYNHHNSSDNHHGQTT